MTDDLIKQAEELSQKLTSSITWSPQGARRLEIASVLRQLIAKVKEREGWVLVPVEPTEEMLQVGITTRYDRAGRIGTISIYKAMIAASKDKP